MIKVVLNGSEYISLLEIDTKKTLQERDKLVEDRLLFFKKLLQQPAGQEQAEEGYFLALQISLYF
jgi:hypothetical protein